MAAIRKKLVIVGDGACGQFFFPFSLSLGPEITKREHLEPIGNWIAGRYARISIFETFLVLDAIASNSLGHC